MILIIAYAKPFSTMVTVLLRSSWILLVQASQSVSKGLREQKGEAS